MQSNGLKHHRIHKGGEQTLLEKLLGGGLSNITQCFHLLLLLLLFLK